MVVTAAEHDPENLPRVLQGDGLAGASAGGDETGRFCLRTYRLGEKMAWYDSNDPQYHEWRSMDFTGLGFRWANAETDEAVECCALLCPQCKSTDKELAAILRFRALRCVEVLKLCYDDEITWDDLGRPYLESEAHRQRETL